MRYSGTGWQVRHSGIGAMGDTTNKATVENRIRFDSKNMTVYTNTSFTNKFDIFQGKLKPQILSILIVASTASSFMAMTSNRTVCQHLTLPQTTDPEYSSSAASMCP